MARGQGPDEVTEEDKAFSSEVATGSREENASETKRAPRNARNENSGGGGPSDDGLQFLPLLRGALRGVSGDGNAAFVFRRRPQLPRQPLPRLRRLLYRLPVLA